MKRLPPIARRTPDRTVRDEMAILERLGFRYLGMNAAGHHIFEHPEHGRLRPMSSTPRNAMSWRRRHRTEVAALLGLNLFQFQRLIAGQPLQRRARPSRGRRVVARRRPLSLVTAAAERVLEPAPVAIRRPERTSCIDCGRPWLSDLDFTYRPCPQCGGQVVAGRDAA